MGTTLNRKAYQRLVDENIEWLYTMPRTLERDHIIMIVKHSVSMYYPEQSPNDMEVIPGSKFEYLTQEMEDDG